MNTISVNALSVRDLVVEFGHFRAINNLNFTTQFGHVHAVIGPNGAGKTTLLDIFTGRSQAQSGSVLLEEKVELTGLNEVQLALIGIGRKFQKPSVFEALTVSENLDLAFRQAEISLFREVFSGLDRNRNKNVAEMLQTISLDTHSNVIAGTLSHGQKQWLEIGMVLMRRPKVILLDEPVAGMSDDETDKTAKLVRALRSPDRAIVVVEHDMDFVEEIADVVTVLDQGAAIFEGEMKNARNDPRVLDVYIGR